MAKISDKTLIYHAPLSRRAINILLNNCELFGVKWVPGTLCSLAIIDLSGTSVKDLNEIYGAGPGTIKEIEDLCMKAGVGLNA